MRAHKLRIRSLLGCKQLVMLELHFRSAARCIGGHHHEAALAVMRQAAMQV